MKNFFIKLKLKIKLREMDECWMFWGGNCFGLFPPSFYLTHSEKEIQRITKEELARLQSILDEYTRTNREQKVVESSDISG